MLLRVPGIGVTCAKRIIRARRGAYLDFDGLKKLGVVMKRAQYFITCKGKNPLTNALDPRKTANLLCARSAREVYKIENPEAEQMSLFESDILSFAGKE